MMEFGSQKTQIAASSCCRSFGSSQHPSGQFPKISIGITVEKCLKKAGSRKEDSAALPAGGRTVLSQTAEETPRPQIVEVIKRNRLDGVEDNKTSAWFSTKSVQVETPTAETVNCYVNRGSLVQSEDGMCRRFDTVAYGKKREKGGNVERAEEFAFASMQETQLVEKRNAGNKSEEITKFSEKRLSTVISGKRRDNNGNVGGIAAAAISTKQLVCKDEDKDTNQMDKCNNGAFKMKLWEILGTDPSQNKRNMKSPKSMECKGSLHVNESWEDKKSKVVSTKLNMRNLEENKENLNEDQSREYKKGKAARVKPVLQELEQNRQDLAAKQSKQFQRGKAPRAKQNSDSIETDSESPNQVTRRPVTRSLTRKKGPSKRVEKSDGNVSYLKRPLSASSSDLKLQPVKNNTFAFDEVEDKAGSSGHTSTGQSNRSKEKITDQNKAKIEPRRISFSKSKLSNSEKSLPNSDKEQASVSRNKASSESKGKGNSSELHQDKKHFMQHLADISKDSCHPQRDVQPNFDSPLWAYNRATRESSDSPLLKMKKHSWGCDNSPPHPDNTVPHDDDAEQSMGKGTHHYDDFHSPTLAMNDSPTSPSMPDNVVLPTPPAVRPSKSNKITCRSKDLDNYTPGSFQPDADSESSDDTREMRKPGDMESPHMKEEAHESAKQQFSLSPMEEQDTESEADDLISQGADFGLADKWFLSPGSPKKSPFSIHQTKIARGLNNGKLCKINMSSPCPVEASRTEETVASFEALEQFPEGSLARCFSQLILMLQRFKARIKSQTSKRSSEILSAAADKIRQQLQNVESQILGDAGKFNNSGKSKRKRLELRFQEQQERLKLIHDKFKEEVNQHLLDCRSILEDLEAYNIELKGTADRQKASHRKLLSQAEEAMDAEINDAEASIVAVQKDARKKMIGLNHVLQEWMN